jgi:uroporphyrinogen III methyltransferase / synthase
MSSNLPAKTYGLFASPRNRKTIAGLTAGGADVLIFPAVETAPVDASGTDSMLSEALSSFDWLVFPDVLTVDYLIERLRQMEIDPFELDALRVCAAGEAVADRLRFVQVHADVVPARLDAESVCAAVAEYSGGELENLRFCLALDKSGPSALAEKLRAAGAEIVEIPIYEAHFADQAAALKLKTLLRGGAVDEFVFSAAEDLIGLAALFPGESPAEMLRGTSVSATSESIFLHLQQCGLRPLYFNAK